MVDTDIDTLSDDLVTPEYPTSAATANYVYIKVLPLPHILSADLTGKFPVTADSGAQYVLISEMDGYIHAEAMTSRHHSAYIASFTRTINFFTSFGRPPFFLRLDNETTLPLDKFIQKQKIQIQYCPRYRYRCVVSRQP